MIEREIEESKRLNGRPSFKVVLDAFREQTLHPPGNDPSIGSFYNALSSLTQEDPDVESFLRDAYYGRTTISPSHYTNLAFRDVQYINLFVNNSREYLNFKYADQWVPVIKDIFAKQGNLFKDILLNKETVTTVYQRYAGPRALMGLFFEKKPLVVADFGCGANHGLRGIDLNEPFGTILDQTPDNNLSRMLSLPVSIEDGWAIDATDFESPEDKQWYIACSFYPKEIDNVYGVRELEGRLSQSKKVSFIQRDLLAAPLPEHFNGYFDVVVLSTVLYQHTLKNQEKFLNEASKVSSSNGVIIVQDFAEKDPSSPTGLKFTEDWFNGYRYRTFIIRPTNPEKVCEVFQWSDGRCTEVRQGEDFNELLSNIK